MIKKIPVFFRQLQNKITDRLEHIDNKQSFREDEWSREEGGGGVTKVMSDGRIFEKAGVNFSEVYGDRLPDSAYENLSDVNDPAQGFSATGISLVIHPQNPYIPTVHMNYRYFETGDIWWFGGGADLTPYYPFREDVVHFHKTLKTACDKYDESFYPQFKQWCDDYFYIEHRNEPRGVGGIFFDHLTGDFEKLYQFVHECGESFLPSYEPIILNRQDIEYGKREREFQLYRRSRYVEFNLVYDRGTKFGLQTAGRIESILMSLPPLVRWKYDYHPEPGSPESRLYEEFLQKREWI